MVHVYGLKIDIELNESQFQTLINKVAADKKEKIQKFFKREDAVRCLLSDLFTRYVLIHFFDFKKEEVFFEYSFYGKPSLTQETHIHFNSSHSGQWIVLAVDDKPVGMDVEQIKPIDLEIADQYFSIEEQQKIFALKPSEQLDFFYELWTLKESFVKMKGEGLSIPLDGFSVYPDENEKIFFASKLNLDETPSFKQYEIDSNYKISVCSLSDSFDTMKLVYLSQVVAYFES